MNSENAHDPVNGFDKHSGPNKRHSLVLDKNWLDYLWIIREHWIIGLLFAAIVASFFAYQKFQAVPLYRASTILLYEPQKDRVINIQSVVDSSVGRSFELILKNHLTDLRSNTFRRRVVNSLTPEEVNLVVKDYADPESGDTPNPNFVVAGANKISLVGGNIFNFEFHHRNPQAAALLSTRFSEEFLDSILERQRKKTDAALRFLRSQSEELKLKVERSELAVQKYRQERNLVSLEESQNLIVERMKNLSGSLNGAKLDLLNYNSKIEQIESAGNDLDELAKLPVITQMGTLPSKFEQRMALIGERKSLSLRYGKRHPRMIENQTRLEALNADIEATLEKNISDLYQLQSQAVTRVETIKTALAQAEQDSLELDQIAIEYNVLRRKLDTDQRLFTQVHQRLNEAILASQLSDSNLRIVDEAWPPSAPFTPDTSKIYTMTAFIFIAAFVAVPYGIHYLNLNLKTAAELEGQLEIPFLGEIRKFPRKIKDPHLLVLNQLDHQATESFRQLHSQILLKNRKSTNSQTYIVTSAIPKEGKSFFAINLAASFSRHHYKTLLIDCDFRRPSIVGLLRNDLGNRLKSNQTSSSTPINLADNFDVLPFTDSTMEATEIIESAEFQNMIREHQRAYNIVIIDTAPAGLFPDAGMIGNFADYFLFVTQLGKHRKGTLKAILNRIDQSKAEILGVVVNKVSKSKSRNLGTFRYMNYEKYKSYYPEKTESVS
jgi:capsular exopolysaccharide synthesis family protein